MQHQYLKMDLRGSLLNYKLVSSLMSVPGQLVESTIKDKSVKHLEQCLHWGVHKPISSGMLGVAPAISLACQVAPLGGPCTRSCLLLSQTAAAGAVELDWNHGMETLASAPMS